MQPTEFKRIIFHVANEIEAKVESIFEPSTTPNFFAAELAKEGFHVFILCSNQSEWAFSRNYDENSCTLDFADFKDFSEIIESQFGYKPYSSTALNGPFEPRAYMLESDIKYWKPKSLGEALFNWWD